MIDGEDNRIVGVEGKDEKSKPYHIGWCSSALR